MAKKKAKESIIEAAAQADPDSQSDRAVPRQHLAIGDYDRCCAIEDIAKHPGKTEGRVKKLVSQLVAQGYLQLDGGLLETAYPTVAAIQQQDPSVSAEAARALIRTSKG